MRAILLLSATLSLSATAAFAQTSYNVVVEPVAESFDSIITAPIEYDENGVVKAQHFKAGDLTDAQYNALLREADRIRAYQSANGTGFEEVTTTVVEPVTTYSYGDTTTETYDYVDTQSYEIDLFAPAAPTTVATTQMHTVAKGDTLYNISKRYNTTVGALQAENKISGSALSIGQVMTIPNTVQSSINSSFAQPIFASAPVQDGYVTRRVVQPVAGQAAAPVQTATQIYAVLPKDTLYGISRRTCVAVADLISTNGIANPNALKPGQRLTLPAGHCLAR